MLEVIDLHKAYMPATPVLAGITLTVAAGEIVCLLGPSGCGKTTLLRVIAGLEQAERGLVRVAGDDLAQIPVHKRNFGFMFQDFALFPHRTVGENVAFGLRMAGQKPAQIATRVAEMLALVNLHGYETRSVFALSGGERQRVALARSLAPNPRLIMLDEPLGSLDRSLREELMGELRAILKRVGVTALYVTHDQAEAFAVADRIVLMHRGQIEQAGAPEALYYQPATEFVARFLGFHNLLPATRLPGEDRMVETAIGRFVVPTLASTFTSGTLLIRPDAASAVPADTHQQAASSLLRGKLVAASFRGNHYLVQLWVGELMGAADAGQF